MYRVIDEGADMRVRRMVIKVEVLVDEEDDLPTKQSRALSHGSVLSGLNRVEERRRSGLRQSTSEFCIKSSKIEVGPGFGFELG